MSKRTVTLNNLSDGINSDSDPKLIQDSSCVNSVNMIFDDLGRIKSTSGFIASTKPYVDEFDYPTDGAYPYINNGNGVFSFEADYNLVGIAIRTVYIVYKTEYTEASVNYTKIHVRNILDNTEVVYGGTIESPGLGGHNLNLRFYYSNNRLFIYNNDMLSGFGILYFSTTPQKRFPESSNPYDFTGWHFFEFPYEGIDSLSRTFGDGMLRCYCSNEEVGTNNYVAGNYAIGTSLMFGDGSESKIMRLPSANLFYNSTVTAMGVPTLPISGSHTGVDIRFMFTLVEHDAIDIDMESIVLPFLYPYIIGQRIYISEVNPNPLASERNLEWKHMGDFNYNKGFIHHESSEYRPILNGAGADYTMASPGSTSDWSRINYPTAGSNFRFMSGYSLKDSTDLKFKSLSVFQNRSFVANIEQNGNKYGDRLVISPLGKPSLFPESNFIDLEENDGDEYVALQSFGSTVFAFKRHSLVVIDCSSNDPNTYFVRSKHRGLGVDNDFSICKTEMGLFFANKNGIFFHNGESNQNITFNKIEREWKLLDNSKVVTGYDDINKKILFTTDLSESKITYVYDLKTQSFSKFNYVNSVGASKVSNYFTMNNVLTSAMETPGAGTFFESNFDNRASAGAKVLTKQFDLGLPSVRKKIRRFYVSFKESPILANITFKYSIDNGAFVTIPNNKKSFVTGSNNIVMFDLDRSLTIYYVQIEISSNNKIEINDISIVYRLKNPK